MGTKIKNCSQINFKINMPILTYKNIQVHFTSEGSGRAIVLLHGFLENITMWNEIVPVLAIKNRIICIDLLGHGKTENLGYVHTMEEQAKMVKFVLNHLNLRKYAFIGHSMGTYIALAFSEFYSENIKGLCLMNSTAMGDPEDKKSNRDRAIAAVKHSPKTFVKLAIPNLFAEENRPKFRKEIELITKEALEISQQGIIAALEGMKIREDRTNILKSSNFPMLMVIGKQDPALDYNTLIDQTNHTKVERVEYPDGHMSHIENKNALIIILQNFCKICS